MLVLLSHFANTLGDFICYGHVTGDAFCLLTPLLSEKKYNRGERN